MLRHGGDKEKGYKFILESLGEENISSRKETENLLKSAFEIDSNGEFDENYLFSQIPRKIELVFKKVPYE